MKVKTIILQSNIRLGKKYNNSILKIPGFVFNIALWDNQH